MVYIKKIEIRGFKSFGGRPLALALEPGLNVVTGPNGSGKSNIMDAVLFCLGENSPRLMRVNKLASLIHEGADIQRMLSARVSLTLDNLDRGIPLDTDNITLTREIRSNGESVYYLNGKRSARSNLEDILELSLMNPDGLNVVPQGMVMRIAELSPDQKRSLMGDLVGVTQFDQKKAEATRQLNEADVKLQIAMATISEKKEKIEELESQRNDQLRLRQVEDSIRWLKATEASNRLVQVRYRIREQDKMLKQLRGGVIELQERVENSAKAYDDMENERSSFLSRFMDSGGGARIELQFEITRTSSEIERIKNEITQTEASITQLQEAIPTLDAMEIERSREHDAAIIELDKISNELQKLQQEKAQREAKILENQNTRKSLEKDLEAAAGKVKELNERLLLATGRIERFNTKLMKIRGDRSIVEERLKSLESRSLMFRDTLATLESDKIKMEELLQTVHGSLDELDKQSKTLQKVRRRLEAEVAKALATTAKAADTLIRYESEAEILNSVASEEIQLKRLSELASTGALDGFLGRLDQLIKYDKRYEPAIEAAGRRWLNAAVVKDMKALVRVIEAAKRLRLGRFSIISVADVSEARPIGSPRGLPNLGPLSSYISTAPELKGVVNLVWGGTLLVNNTRDAYRASTLELRAVTLTGDLFESEGIFETGVFNKLELVEDLVTEERPLSEVKDALTSLREQISNRRNSLTQIESQTEDLLNQRNLKGISTERLAAEVTTVGKFLTRYRALSAKLDKKVQNLSRLLEKFNLRISQLEAKQAKAATRLETIRNRLADNQSEKIRGEMYRLDEEQASLTRDVEELTLHVHDAITRKTSQSANILLMLNENLSRIRAQLSESRRTLDDKLKSLDEIQKSLGPLTVKLEELRRQESGLLEEARSYQPILDNYDRKLKLGRANQDSIRRGLINAEREFASAERGVERLRESENQLLGELTLLGYADPPEPFDAAAHMLRQLQLEYEELRNNVNLLAEKSYAEGYGIYRDHSNRKNQLESERNSIVQFIESVEKDKQRAFLEAYTKIDREFRAIFSKLTGGAAWLELENPDEIFSGGIYLMTQFPGKVAREASSVSGGEKTATAVSFLLAIQSFNPSPFYLMDEIDAHLDPVNSEKLSLLLAERASPSQIIVISLKDNLVARSTMTYGVYMRQGVSNVVKYRPNIEVTVTHE
jgi:chromosome segregation protein